jgi:hypothetical protein
VLGKVINRAAKLLVMSLISWRAGVGVERFKGLRV